MGYTTYFSGEFAITPAMKPEHIAYINKFSETRRMKRNELAAQRPDPIREAVGLPLGEQGGYFVGAGGHKGQDEHGRPDIIDYNDPPTGQPGLWCHWIVSDDGAELAWDEGEKFYYYVEWLQYLVDHFLAPWGYAISGEVSWSGEEDDDKGVIYAKDNRIEAVDSVLSNAGPSWGKADA